MMMMAKMTGCLQPPPPREWERSISKWRLASNPCSSSYWWMPWRRQLWSHRLSFFSDFFLFSKLSSVSKPIQSNWVAKWISITRPFHFNWALRRTQSVFCSKKGLGIWQIWQIVSIFPFMYSSVPKFLTLSLGLFFVRTLRKWTKSVLKNTSLLCFPFSSFQIHRSTPLVVIDALDLEAACLLDFPDSVETLKFVFQQFLLRNWFWMQWM